MRQDLQRIGDSRFPTTVMVVGHISCAGSRMVISILSAPSLAFSDRFRPWSGKVNPRLRHDRPRAGIVFFRLEVDAECIRRVGAADRRNDSAIYRPAERHGHTGRTWALCSPGTASFPLRGNGRAQGRVSPVGGAPLHGFFSPVSSLFFTSRLTRAASTSSNSSRNALTASGSWIDSARRAHDTALTTMSS
jgi:hypothetical protein